MKSFLIELFKQMSTGDFTVEVRCQDDKCFKADVIGYNENYQTVSVRFHSDNLVKSISTTEEVKSWGFDMEPKYESVIKKVPIKEETVYYERIKLNK